MILNFYVLRIKSITFYNFNRTTFRQAGPFRQGFRQAKATELVFIAAFVQTLATSLPRFYQRIHKWLLWFYSRQI